MEESKKTVILDIKKDSDLEELAKTLIKGNTYLVKNNPDIDMEMVLEKINELTMEDVVDFNNPTPHLNTYKDFPFTMSEMEDINYSHIPRKQRYIKLEPVRTEPKIGRNDLCSCGSGKKYKKCCGK